METEEKRWRKWWRQISSQDLALNKLCFIIVYVEPLREMAWQKFLEQNSDDNLRFFIKYLWSLSERDWQEFLRQNPSNPNLHYVIGCVRFLREKIKEVLPIAN